MPDPDGSHDPMRCRCGAAVEHAADLDAAADRECGLYGQPYNDGSWMIHVEPPIGGAHVPRLRSQDSARWRRELGLDEEVSR